MSLSTRDKGYSPLLMKIARLGVSFFASARVLAKRKKKRFISPKEKIISDIGAIFTIPYP